MARSAVFKRSANFTITIAKLSAATGRQISLGQLDVALDFVPVIRGCVGTRRPRSKTMTHS
jgi:hypothetical protein